MMQGFFTKQQTQSISRPDGKIHSCASCGLYRHVQSPRMKEFGNFKKRILNIGKAPDEVDDEKGRSFQGRAGRRLQQEYRRLGIDIFEDCLNINAVNCMVLDKEDVPREPTIQEIACCRNRVLKIITEYQPHIIVLFGTAAVTSLIGHRWKKDLGGIMKWRGWTIPDREFKAWICPVFSPEYVEKSDSPEIDVIWKNDLKQAISMLKKPFPVFEDEEKYVEIIEAKDFMQSSLHDKNPEWIAWDIETTSIKPHASGQRIICASFSANEKHAQVFMIPNNKKERKAFIEILANPKIKKIAHNIKFEHAWALARLRQEVINWGFDTLLATHILDNRPGITSLKFQVYVQFGVINYDEEITPYLRSEGKSGNGMNRILEMIKDPQKKEKLMIYCGLDSLFTFRLAMRQMKQIGIIS